MSLGDISSDYIVAKVQSRIGKLLAQREIILRLKNFNEPGIREAAESLLVDQTRLESDLGSAQAVITKIKAEAYSYAEMIPQVIFLGDVGRRMENQIRAVRDLENEAAGVKPTGFDLKKMATVSGLLYMAAKILRLV